MLVIPVVALLLLDLKWMPVLCYWIHAVAAESCQSLKLFIVPGPVEAQNCAE